MRSTASVCRVVGGLQDDHPQITLVDLARKEKARRVPTSLDTAPFVQVTLAEIPADDWPCDGFRLTQRVVRLVV